MGIKLIFLAIAIILFLVIWAYVRRVSAAAAAAGELADHVLAEQIQRLRARAMASKDSEVIASHSVEIAALEAQRGKLAKRKK